MLGGADKTYREDMLAAAGIDGDTAMTGRKGEITTVISSVNGREIAALQ
jgi:hypothetical protein